ncbi:DUF1905 domain-containing protein [Aeromicrobium camelliae]|uniref:DUF1905 domain-containing protein n=1 Tax=Aeromicrobium camelliae TaxID=1538144 RepID=A0A3N6Z700_9ACTN|nr:DUF1905 domain-containing protein [Aeromicrobium camelliae]RQN02707.1 DUF1905 domain-containing protein [Aeromicrobium camelliae]
MYTFEARVERFEGSAAWHFVMLPEDITDEIEDAAPLRGGFGSVKVRMRCGSSVWETSIFPDTKRGSFLLPMKKAILRAEAVGYGDLVQLELEIR